MPSIPTRRREKNRVRSPLGATTLAPELTIDREEPDWDYNYAHYTSVADSTTFSRGREEQREEQQQSLLETRWRAQQQQLLLCTPTVPPATIPPISTVAPSPTPVGDGDDEQVATKYSLRSRASLLLCRPLSLRFDEGSKSRVMPGIVASSQRQLQKKEQLRMEQSDAFPKQIRQSWPSHQEQKEERTLQREARKSSIACQQQLEQDVHDFATIMSSPRFDVPACGVDHDATSSPHFDVPACAGGGHNAIFDDFESVHSEATPIGCTTAPGCSLGLALVYPFMRLPTPPSNLRLSSTPPRHHQRSGSISTHDSLPPAAAAVAAVAPIMWQSVDDGFIFTRDLTPTPMIIREDDENDSVSTNDFPTSIMWQHDTDSIFFEDASTSQQQDAELLELQRELKVLKRFTAKYPHIQKKLRCVHFAQPVVTGVIYRPFTKPRDMSRLYFSEDELHQLEWDRAQEITEERVECIASSAAHVTGGDGVVFEEGGGELRFPISVSFPTKK